MKTKYRYPPTDDSSQWKCNWFSCAHGMDLAGRGVCSMRGEWWNENCPKYEDEELFLLKWKLNAPKY